MKKRLILITLILALALSIFACSTAANPYSAVYYSAYGEWFCLPACEQAKITDANGNELAIQNGKVLFKKTGNYTATFTKGGASYTSTITVQPGAEPCIYPEKYMDYGVLGEEVDIIKATAKDALGDVEVTGKMYFNGEEVDIEDGFYPEELGEYEYVLTAVSGGGKVGKMTIPYYIEQSADKFSNKITSWDKPYGVNQIGITGEYTYTTDVAFKDEDGSVALNIGRRYNNYESNATNLNQVDISIYDGVYFFVYNGSEASVTVSFGWGAPSFPLIPKAWTKVGVTSKDYERLLKGGYTDQDSYATVQNVNGFQILIDGDESGNLRFNDMIYFSAMRGYKKVSTSQVNNLINAEYEKDQVDVAMTEYALIYYDMLNEEEKASITNAGKLLNRIGEFYAENDGLTYEKNKLLYFDSEQGLNQITNVWSASAKLDEETLFDGKPTVQISCHSGDFNFRVTKSYLRDASDYDVMRLSIYNNCNKDLMFYNNDRNYPGISYQNVTLKAKAWSTIVVSIRDGSILGNYFWIREGNWEMNVMKNTTYNVSAVYAYTIEELIDEAVTTSNPNYLTVSYLSTLLRQCVDLPEETFLAKKETIIDIYERAVAQVMNAQKFSTTDAMSIINTYSSLKELVGSEINACTQPIVKELVDVANAETTVNNRLNHLGVFVEIDKVLLATISSDLAKLYNDTAEMIDAVYNAEQLQLMLEYGYIIGDAVKEKYTALADAYRTVQFGQTLVDFSNADNAGVFTPSQDPDLWTREITTSIAKEGETHSLKITRTSVGSYYLDVDFNVSEWKFGGNENLVFSIYYKPSGYAENIDIMMRRGGWESKNTDDHIIYLKPNQWNELVVPLKGKNAIKDWIMVICKFSWSHIAPGSEFYISNIKVEAQQ